MSTATVEDRRERLEQVREDRIPRLEQRLEDLEEAIAEAVANGEDVEDLKAERREVRDDLENYRAAAPIVERQIREAEKERLQEEAEERLQRIKKRVGGLAGEQNRRVERAVAALEKAREQLEKAAEARALGAALKSEAAILSRVFDLPQPDLRRVRSPKSYQALAGGGAVRGWLDWKPSRVLATYDRMAGGAGRARDAEPRKAIGRLEGIDVPLDSPSGELLDRLAELEQDETN